MLKCLKEVNTKYFNIGSITIFNKVGLPICYGIKEIREGKAYIEMNNIYKESIREGGTSTDDSDQYVRFGTKDGVINRLDLWIKGINAGLISVWIGNLYIKV